VQDLYACLKEVLAMKNKQRNKVNTTGFLEISDFRVPKIFRVHSIFSCLLYLTKIIAMKTFVRTLNQTQS